MGLHRRNCTFCLYKSLLLLSSSILFIAGCKLPFGETDARDTEKNSLSLKFKPQPGSRYRYELENETNLSLEMEGKETEKFSKFNVATTYGVERDTGNTYMFKVNYEKVHLETKSNEVETVSDAENANISPNGIDKMLGALKETTLVIAVTPAKEIKILSGYDELSQKLLSTLSAPDLHTKELAQQKIDEVVKNGLIKRNVDQLFRFFPDSSVRIGSKWTINSKTQADFTLNLSTTYNLNEIENGVAFLSSKSVIKSDKTPLAMMGYSVVPDLSGEEEGAFQVEASTSMLLNASINSTVKGSLQMGSSSIPVSIRIKVNIEGKRL